MSATAEITMVIVGALLLVGLAIVVGYLLNERKRNRTVVAAPGPVAVLRASGEDDDPTGLHFSREGDEPSLSPAPCARGKSNRIAARVERIYGVDRRPGSVPWPKELRRNDTRLTTVNLAERAAVLRVARGDEETQRLRPAVPSPADGRKAS